MKYWLMKSEPTTFSIDHLMTRPLQTAYWDGVRNYQARNMLRDDMKLGDLAFFYHSNCKPPGIVGIVEIVTAGYPDQSAFDSQNKYFDPDSDPKNPRWYGVDVKFKEKFPHMVTLNNIKSLPELKQMRLVQKGNRLSITPVTEQEWKVILHASKKLTP